nr:YchJ family metal-binding protein [Streptomyces sp. FT05W]
MPSMDTLQRVAPSFSLEVADEMETTDGSAFHSAGSTGIYLLRTWHPDTRPPGVDFDPAMRWTGLEILETTDGSAFHSAGTVTFRARYTDGGRPDALHEKSRFARHEGAWVYAAAVFVD